MNLNFNPAIIRRDIPNHREKRKSPQNQEKERRETKSRRLKKLAYQSLSEFVLWYAEEWSIDNPCLETSIGDLKCSGMHADFLADIFSSLDIDAELRNSGYEEQENLKDVATFVWRMLPQDKRTALFLENAKMKTKAEFAREEASTICS